MLIYFNYLYFANFCCYIFSVWLTADQAESITFTELKRSKMPSQPRIMKSCLFSSIVNCEISGSAITTPGRPLNFYDFASMSPKVLETLKRPGNTLNGP